MGFRFVAVAALAVVFGALLTLGGRLPYHVNSDGKSASLIVYGGQVGPSRSRLGPSSDDVAIVSLAVNSNHTTKRGASMPGGRSYFGSVSVNDTVYLVGGAYGPDSDDDGQNFWSYDISTDKWTTLPNFPDYISVTTLVQVNGTTLVAAGGLTDGWALTKTYAYDLTSVANKGWQVVSNPGVIAFDIPCTVTVDAKIYFLGGGLFFRSDDAGRTWSELPTPHDEDGLDSSACAPLGDDMILVTGGAALWYDNAKKDVKAFNITSNSWVNMQPMIRARTGHAAVVLPAANNNNVLVCGGFAHDDVYDDCEIFDGKTHNWSLATDIKLDQPRLGFGLVVAETSAVNA